MGLKDVYLIVYNVCLCVAWATIYTTGIQTLVVGFFEKDVGVFGALSKIYAAENVALTLTYAQSAALLEIVHAGLGLVRSPVLITAMQVGSRIVALIAIIGSVQAQSKCIYFFHAWQSKKRVAFFSSDACLLRSISVSILLL